MRKQVEYEVMSESHVGNSTIQTVARRGRGVKAFEACPVCFNLGTGGGIIIGGACTGCGFSIRTGRTDE